MKNLEEEQREMRERMRDTKAKKAPIESGPHVGSTEAKDFRTLLKRIAALEAENNSLRRQLSALSDQTRPQKHSPEMSENERRHLFMKYSNVRRY
jgi:predicted  nucleic acid-binding Zn-ribbon protein